MKRTSILNAHFFPAIAQIKNHAFLSVKKSGFQWRPKTNSHILLIPPQELGQFIKTSVQNSFHAICTLNSIHMCRPEAIFFVNSWVHFCYSFKLNVFQAIFAQFFRCFKTIWQIKLADKRNRQFIFYKSQCSSSNFTGIFLKKNLVESKYSYNSS